MSIHSFWHDNPHPHPSDSPASQRLIVRLMSPHGYPLRSGLGVKDEGAPKWSPGRRGDVRDVWRQACKGVEGKVGKVVTVLGREKVVQTEMAEVSQWVNGAGWWMKEKRVERVAIALSNSVELLVLVFGELHD